MAFFLSDILYLGPTPSNVLRKGLLGSFILELCPDAILGAHISFGLSESQSRPGCLQREPGGFAPRSPWSQAGASFYPENKGIFLSSKELVICWSIFPGNFLH